MLHYAVPTTVTITVTSQILTPIVGIPNNYTLHLPLLPEGGNSTLKNLRLPWPSPNPACAEHLDFNIHFTKSTLISESSDDDDQNSSNRSNSNNTLAIPRIQSIQTQLTMTTNNQQIKQQQSQPKSNTTATTHQQKQRLLNFRNLQQSPKTLMVPALEATNFKWSMLFVKWNFWYKDKFVWPRASILNGVQHLQVVTYLSVTGPDGPQLEWNYRRDTLPWEQAWNKGVQPRNEFLTLNLPCVK